MDRLEVRIVVQLAQPGLSILDHNPARFTVPYFSTSISLTTTLTLLLVGRLVYMSYRAKWYAGPEYAATYVSVAAMLIETALPYAVTGVVFIVCFARGSPAQNLVRPVLTQIMCINPELIVLRVAMGRALSGKVAAALAGSPDSRFRTTETFELRTVESGTLRESELSSKKGDLDMSENMS